MKQSSNNGRGWRIVEFVIASILFSLSCILFGVCTWLLDTFGISFQELLYTLTSPLEGSDMSLVFRCLKACVPELFILILFILFAIAVCRLQSQVAVTMKVKVFRWTRKFNFWNVLRHLMSLFSIAAFLYSVQFTNRSLGIQEYLELRANPTTIYEDRYIDPTTVQITAPQEKKNLIHIYLESMETTYASTDVSGRQMENYIPNLTALAQEHISFSNGTQLGGWHAASGTTWTMGALFSTTSGIPFSFPVGPNSMFKYENFAAGCTSLGEILAENGYYNAFLCGSDAAFAGRDKYFQQHGGYDIFDLYTAQSEGYIPEDYFDGWWGYEDEILYEIAKDKLTAISQSSQPFCFTMLTVDTHHINGHPCSQCQDTYASITANVVSCADRQIYEFIQWCSQQDFYENTVIIVTGDHPRMDQNLVENVEFYDRTVYNCFLNCPLPDGARLQNREFTAMDLFPTTLAALGFELEGDQLGLGVNLFSDSDTLSEAMGYEVFNQEISKYSSYYVERFS